MDLSSKSSFPFSPEKLCVQVAPWQEAMVWAAFDDVFLDPVLAGFVWPRLVLVAEDMNGQPLTTLNDVQAFMTLLQLPLVWGFFEDYKGGLFEDILCLIFKNHSKDNQTFQVLLFLFDVRWLALSPVLVQWWFFISSYNSYHWVFFFEHWTAVVMRASTKMSKPCSGRITVSGESI